MRAPRFIANFDSASAMVRATAACLRGERFRNLGIVPALEPMMPPLGRAVNGLPSRLREGVYSWSGWLEAIPASKLRDVRIEKVSAWIADEYPDRPYPAVMIGSSNGAAVHLCAAIGIPFIPQTVLIPLRQRGVHPDHPRDDMEAALEPARILLAANPDVQLHHMHDAVQDRLMIRRMTYFRVKRLRLGQTLEHFLRGRVTAGGTIYVIDCGLRWPTTRLDERHFFQHGALGGATSDDYYGASDRVAEYLERCGSHRRSWDAPNPDGERPEAEWGFEPVLRADIERVARECEFKVSYISFREPEDLSPLVADLYRSWYGRHGISPTRLLIESFIMLEPRAALRSNHVPLWTVFNTESSLRRVERYIRTSEAFDEIRMTLFSHGIESLGYASIDRWRAALAKARRANGFLGVDERAYPRDFATFTRYSRELEKLEDGGSAVPPLDLRRFDEYVQREGPRHGITVASA